VGIDEARPACRPRWKQWCSSCFCKTAALGQMAPELRCFAAIPSTDFVGVPLPLTSPFPRRSSKKASFSALTSSESHGAAGGDGSGSTYPKALVRFMQR